MAVAGSCAEDRQFGRLETEYETEIEVTSKHFGLDAGAVVQLVVATGFAVVVSMARWLAATAAVDHCLPLLE